MKVLVTGGAGFIGSNFIKYILNKYRHYTVINLDCLTYAGNLENLRDIEGNDKYVFIRGSISDTEAVEKAFSMGVDFVVNFAAESHVDRSILDPGIFVKTNVLGTQILLDVSRRLKIKKFLQVSTDEVYGSLGTTGYFTENTPLSPNSPYSASKAAADMFVRAYYETFGLDINITRCSNNYGPYQFPEKLIPLMISNTLVDKELPVYGDGLNIRDWLYVEDHCTALDTVLHNAHAGEVYNIGGNNEKANIEIVKLILNYLDKPESLIKYVKDRLGHDRRYAIDSSKIKSDLGWQPKYSFEDAIKITIKWYLNNNKWLQNIQSGNYKDYYEQMYGTR